MKIGDKRWGNLESRGMTNMRSLSFKPPKLYTALNNKGKQYFIINLLTMIGFILRIIRIDRPYDPVFDERYYIRNALDLLKHGVEFNSYSDTYWLVVHPPLGKWMLTPGILLFGDNSLGWRFMSLLLGSLAIALVGLIAVELFNSLSITFLTTFFMIIDGVSFVNSRTGTLESPLIFFTLLSTLLFLKALKNSRYLPYVGISMGLALAVKWNAIFQLFAFILIYLIHSTSKFHTNTLSDKVNKFVKLKMKVLLNLAIIPVFTYIVSWSGWFLTKVGQFRDWGETHATEFPYIPAVIRSFWHYHGHIIKFHQTLTQDHPAQAQAYQWLLGRKPTIFYRASGARCSEDKINGMYELCGSVIIQLQNPVILYGSLLSLVALIILLLRKIMAKKFIINSNTGISDLAPGIPVLLIVSLYLPWFLYPERTTFTYYTDIFMPYLIIILAYSLVRVANKVKDKKMARNIVFLTIILALLFFIYFYPLYTNYFLSYQFIDSRLWLIDNFRM